MKKVLTFFLLVLSVSAMGQTYSKDLEKSAKKGDVAAQRDLGICYLNGEGTKVDNQKAFEWLCQAATQDAKAQYYLGLMFEEGKADIANDKKEHYKNLLRTLDYKEQKVARETPNVFWYIKAATGNSVEAMLISGH